ncbi:MAG: redox-regulated ATPase YchF [Candidatus Wolfebacteria bacterium]|nr:redox-regulated ATPase YchF [Candidatus Wolfebacteria bacterium]
MKLSIGIVGLPNVGKSTLFKALTKNEVHIANYPFATIDPNIGVVSVPDERLGKLASISRSKKIVPAVVEFYDIAGLVKGANKGEGLGNQFLSHIKDVEAIVQVVRCFQKSDIIHVEEKVDPSRDIETINTELILKDLETVERRLEKLDGEARTGDKQKIKDKEIVENIKDKLNKGELLTDLSDEIKNSPVVKEMNLLTTKKQIYLLNGKEEDVSEELKEKISAKGGSPPEADAPLEHASGGKSLNADYLIADLSQEDSVNELIKKAYEILELISFLTTGEDETRAWTIKKGSKAPQAAGTIHTDFENKFIRAEVINWEKLLEVGDWSSAKQKGLIRTEGKEYEVKDGDVIVVRHS